MVSPALLALILALLTSNESSAEENSGLEINKCCGVYQMLSANGKFCVESSWPRNTHFHRAKYNDFVILPPLDSEWVKRWFPPGFPLQNISSVRSHSSKTGFVSSVNATTLWDATFLQNEGRWRHTVAFLGELYIAWPSPGGRLRRVADYCVDAAKPPLGPFAIQFRTRCSGEECARSCCSSTQVLKKSNVGLWECANDAAGFWTPTNSSLALDPEFPFDYYSPSKSLRLSSWEVRNARQALRRSGYIKFQFSYWWTCFDFYRNSDGILHEGLFYEEYSRITRGFYRMVRPLCVLSTLLVLTALVAIACDKSMRRKTHGRCLFCHALCLLAFNIGQIVYFSTISDEMDKQTKLYIPPDFRFVCKYAALWMYFLLTAAWCWLTALCVNMAKGFSLQVGRLKKESMKRFLALSGCAWGLPVLMTFSTSFLIAHEVWYSGDIHWYNPSLAESRVCYSKFSIRSGFLTDHDEMGNPTALEYGTILFYFGPVSCLVMCNIICLVLTLRKVQYLKRGNSVLRREEDQIPLAQRQPDGNNIPSAHTATGHANRNRSGSNVDAKTIKLYIKMILLSGGNELLTEIIMWSTIVFDDDHPDQTVDWDLAYRAAGYVTDFFRAAIVTWLAAPEGGYLGLVRRLRRGKGEKKKNVA